ncbi:MAG: glycosyltransferase family 9 protein [Bacteroidota bacterium]
MNGGIHRILIIRFSSVGDIVLSSLLVRVLGKALPQARMDYAVKSAYAPLVRHNPGVHRVLELGEGEGAGGLFRLRREAGGYDLLVDIHDSIRSRLLCAGHRRTVRVRKRKAARWLLVRAGVNLYDRLGEAPPVAERYLETVQHLGAENDGRGLDLFLPPASVARAARFLGEQGIGEGASCIGLCPSARHATKIWPAEHFARAGAELSQGRGGVLLFGSADESGRCGRIAGMLAALAPGVPVLNCAGTLDLLETASAMDRCAVVLSNDSGLMHVAAARKRPVVALFGSTVREFGFAPYGTPGVVLERAEVRCRPCTHVGRAHCPRGHFRCMRDIPPGDAVAAANRFLADGGA